MEVFIKLLPCRSHSWRRLSTGCVDVHGIRTVVGVVAVDEVQCRTEDTEQIVLLITPALRQTSLSPRFDSDELRIESKPSLSLGAD